MLTWESGRLFALSGLLSLSFACGSDAAPTNQTAATRSSSARATEKAQGGTGAVRASSITWTAPESFKLVDSPSTMRLATYKIAHAEGDSEDAELSVTQVGGGAKANLDRWRGQFQSPNEREASDTTVGDLKVSVIWLEGAYGGMAMGPNAAATPKGDYALLGAVVEWPGHGDPHFFKMTGPKKTVEAARPAFDELVHSLAPKG